MGGSNDFHRGRHRILLVRRRGIDLLDRLAAGALVFLLILIPTALMGAALLNLIVAAAISSLIWRERSTD